jgi:hypothetical protein
MIWNMFEAYPWYMVYGYYGHAYILAHGLRHILVMLGICFERFW